MRDGERLLARPVYRVRCLLFFGFSIAVVLCPPAAHALDAATPSASGLRPTTQNRIPAGGVSSAYPHDVAPASSGGRQRPPRHQDVRIHEDVVFEVNRGHGERSAIDRARAAARAIEKAIATDGAEDVRVAHQDGSAVVFVGSIPVIELYQEDAAATGASSLRVYANSVATRVEEIVRAEKKRTAVASTVFSMSLVVFFGLIALYVIRKIGEFARRARRWTLENPEEMPAIRLRKLEVAGPAALRGGLLASLVVGRLIAQIGVGYAWLVFTLSLFAATRPYTTRLTGFIVTPLSELTARLAASFPLAVVALVCGVAIYLLVRFVQLFLASVARGETELEWLPKDLALPTSALLRGGIVAAALVFAAPVMTGDPEGALARVGSVLLFALAASSTPILASGFVGVFTVYGRKVKVGHHAELGGRSGRILEIGMLDVLLIDEGGGEVRVPHLLSLVHPTRTFGERRRTAVDVSLALIDPDRSIPVLDAAANAAGRRVEVELSDINADGATYRVSAELEDGKTPSDLRLALVRALSTSGIALARSSGGGRP